MKLKKLFAGILAVAMMATMAAPAFAARTPSSYATNGDSKIAVSEDGTITIKKAYAPNNGATAPNETFTLTATKVSVRNSSIKDADFKAAGAYELTITGAKFENGDITDFNVQLPDYGKPGVFVYKLHEIDNGTAGVTYDTNDYYLTVYAFNKADSTAKVEANDLQYAVRLDRGLTSDENYEKKVDTINTHIDNVLKNAPTKLNVAVHASDEDMNAIQNLFNNEHKWILGKMQAHYREINSMFADELRVAQKRYKEYDGCYLGHYIQYFFWFFFTLGFFVFVAVVVSWIGGYNGWFK